MNINELHNCRFVIYSNVFSSEFKNHYIYKFFAMSSYLHRIFKIFQQIFKPASFWVRQKQNSLYRNFCYALVFICKVIIMPTLVTRKNLFSKISSCCVTTYTRIYWIYCLKILSNDLNKKTLLLLFYQKTLTHLLVYPQTGCWIDDTVI